MTVVIGLLAGPVISVVARRPATGVLALAALAPFDGLLLIIPHPRFAEGWKEGLVLLVAAASWRQRQSRGSVVQRQRGLPRWATPMIGLVGVALLSAIMNPSVSAVVGMKIGFFYLLIPLSLWWSPLNVRERDQLVTILMLAAGVVVAVGITQQIVGPEALVSVGYEYNTNVRFASGLLRSFSTFNQPFAYAFFVMAVILVGVPVALEDRRRIRNLLFLVSVPILAAGMVTAVVRAALLGLVIGSLWLLVHRYRFLAHAFVPAFVIAVLLPSGVALAFLSSSSLAERSTGWTQTIFDQGIEPLGQGIGSVGSAAERIEDSRDASQIEFPTPTENQRYQPDNYYVKTLVELGPIGAWLLISAMLFTFSHARAASLHASRQDAGLAAGIAASIIAATSAALVSSYWEIFPADMYFWTLLGVVPSLFPGSSTTPSPSPRVEVASRHTADTSLPPSLSPPTFH